MKMIPTDYLLNNGPSSSKAEKTLFYEFSNMENTDDWICYHSLQFLDKSMKRNIDREFDFVILIQKKGILFLEVKGGGIVYENSVLYTIDRHNQWHEINPAYQVKDTKYAFEKWLNEKSGERVRDISTHCVVFPDANPDKDSLPSEYRDITLTADDYKNLHQNLSRMLSFKRDDLEARIARIHAYLSSNEFKSEMMYNSFISYSHNSDKINYATEEQRRALQMFQLCPKAVFNGIAGSGKSVLAITKALEFAQDNPDAQVLFLCFTRLVAETIKDSHQHTPENLTIIHYHKLASELLNDDFSSDDLSDQNFWDAVVPSRLLELAPVYQCIVVDEAQDFTEDMLMSLESLLIDNDNSRFWLFGDTNQNLFRNASDFSFVNYFKNSSVFMLNTNCRNPSNIANFAYKLIPKMKYDNAINTEYSEMQITATENADAQADAVMALIKREKLEPENVIIIMMKPRRKADHCSLFKSKYAANFVKFGEEHNNKKFVITNILQFKGLEKKVVILVDVDNKTQRTDLYVAATRTTNNLYIFHDKDCDFNETFG